MKYDIFSVVTAVVGKKNWSGFNQPKLRDLGPLSDKKLELLTTNCDLLNLPKSYGGNGWGIPSIYGDILKAQRAQRTKARLNVRMGRASRSSWKVLAKFLEPSSREKYYRCSAANSASSMHIFGDSSMI